MSRLGDRTIHQVMVTAAPGDAVTSAAFEVRALLRQYGKSEIFACNIHEQLFGDVLTFADYDTYSPSDEHPLIMVHISMGDDRLVPFLRGLRGHLIILYHNVTPSTYFIQWDPPMARRLDTGRQSLDLLRDRTVLALANSAYSADELRHLGFNRVRVGALIVGAERLLHVEPEPRPAIVEGPVVLSVGQLYPHKRADLLIAAFHQLVTQHRPDAHLVLAGSDRLLPFRDALQRYVERLGLTPRVTLTGHISEAQLAAWYRRADVFVLASEHEGFCVPLVEAMEFGVPIVARANAAVPETLGDAGILVPGDAGPSTLAAVIAAVLDDPPGRDALVRAGRRRRLAFTADACRRQFLDAMGDVLPSRPPCESS